MTYFTAEQVGILLKPIHPKRVLVRDGMSYVEGYDVKAELNRVFGFGRWSVEILDQSLICETETKTRNNKDAWYVVYKTSLRLTVCAPDGSQVSRYEESHVGESTHPVRGEAHGNALTNSWTYALKRCASNLGDQFGLSLYGKGSMDALVRWTLVHPEAGERAAKVDDSDVPQVAPEMPEDAAAEGGAAGSVHASRSLGGQVSRPAQQSPQRSQAAGECDPDAQPYADEAHEARTLAALQDVNTRARGAHKLASVITNPGTGGTGGLGQYISWRRRQLEEVDSALAALHAAAGSSRLDMSELDIHVRKVTGKDIESASAAELKQAAEALAVPA